MARPKKSAAVKSTSTNAAEETGTDAAEATAIEDGEILDCITGKPVTENDKERVRQRIIWSSKATNEAFTKSAVKIRCRARVTRHGGATQTTVAP